MCVDTPGSVGPGWRSGPACDPPVSSTHSPGKPQTCTVLCTCRLWLVDNTSSSVVYPITRSYSKNRGNHYVNISLHMKHYSRSESLNTFHCHFSIK